MAMESQDKEKAVKQHWAKLILQNITELEHVSSFLAAITVCLVLILNYIKVLFFGNCLGCGYAESNVFCL